MTKIEGSHEGSRSTRWLGRWSLVAALTASVLLPAHGDRSQRFAPERQPLRLVAVQSGFGQLLPHRVPVPDAGGLPTPVIVEITEPGDLAHVRFSNPILPVAPWPVAAVLPDGAPGNHYLWV